MKLPRTRTARRTIAGLVAGTLVGGAAAVTLVPGAEATPKRVEAFGLTASGKLVSFDVRRPDRADTVGMITGLGGERLVGIDIRAANGKLYGVGDEGGLFTINTRSAKASRFAGLDVDLQGGSFGVDVNPAADALRIVSNSGQNLRYSFADDTTTADATLNVPDTTPRVTGVVGSAYTNNDGDDATGTALFALNSATDSIALQVPANAGIITNQGPLGRNATFQAGFDIYTDLKGGRADTNTGYATFGGKRGSSLYRVGTLSGVAEKVGGFKQRVVDLAVVHD